VNYERDFPVIPAATIFWRVNDKLTVNGILPKPALQYQVNDKLTLRVDGSLSDNTYRVNTDFGQIHRVKKLDPTIVEFEEIRVGCGLTWKVNKTFSLNVAAGAVPYRRFDYQRASYKVLSTNTTPYLELVLAVKF
jgi:hypothetical protein